MLLLFLVVLGIYLATASYTINQVNDTRVTAISAWSLGTRGTLALPEAWPDGVERMEVEGVDGRTYTDRFPGAILWGAPFYGVYELVDPRPEPRHPWLLNYAPAGVAAATAAALGVAVCFAVYRRLVGRRLALAAAGILAFGTGTWSVSGDALWTHSVSHLALAVGMLGMSSRRYATGGLGFAAAVLARPQLAVVPAVVGIWEGIRRRSLRPVIVVGFISAAGLGAVSVYSQVLFGTWLPVAGYDPGKVEAVATTGGTVFAERILNAMAHPQRGLFLYAPLLFLLLPGLVRAWGNAPTWVRSAAVAGLFYLLVQLRSNVWHGGSDFFGSRLTLEMLVLASPLFVIAYQRFVAPVRPFKIAFFLLALISVLMHGVGATVMETGLHGADGVEIWQYNLTWLCEEHPEYCE